MDTKRPLLRGFLRAPKLKSESYSIVVHCPYCDDWHCHGWPEGLKSKAAQHRIQHCHPRHENYPNGYWIAPFPTNKIKAFLGVK